MATRPPLQEAVAAYQKANPYTEQSFAAMLPYLQNLGYKVARGTHAANTLPSGDAIVDAESGRVFDVVVGTHTGAPSWGYLDKGVYDPSRKVVGPTGDLVPYTEWAGPGAPAQSAGGAPAETEGGVNTANLGNATPYGAAMVASRMQAKRAQRGGRASTILGGFGAGAPSTRRATLLGGGAL